MRNGKTKHGLDVGLKVYIITMLLGCWPCNVDRTIIMTQAREHVIACILWPICHVGVDMV